MKHATTASDGPHRPGGAVSVASVATTPILGQGSPASLSATGAALSVNAPTVTVGRPVHDDRLPGSRVQLFARPTSPVLKRIGGFFQRGKARRIAQLREESQWLRNAIERARKSRSAVVPLYERQKRVTNELLRLGG